MRDLNGIRNGIVLAMLPGIRQTGWSWDSAKRASAEAGFQDMMCQAVFPDELTGVVAHFTDMVDRNMMRRLEKYDIAELRIRDRIRAAVLARLDFLQEIGAEDAARAALSYWAAPVRVLQGQRVLWRSSDRIWNWAGDISTDYNRYTKRGLLSSLIMGTTLVWLDDDSPRKETTHAFLDRRIENVMELGRAIGTIGGVKPETVKRPWTHRT